jgi:hypothetical protein
MVNRDSGVNTSRVIIIKDNLHKKIIGSNKMHKRKLSHFMLQSTNSTKEDRYFDDPHLSELMQQEADLSRLINARMTFLQEGKKNHQKNEVKDNMDSIKSSTSAMTKDRQSQLLLENPCTEGPAKDSTFDILPQQRTTTPELEATSPLVGSFIQLPFSDPNNNWIWHVSFVLCSFNTTQAGASSAHENLPTTSTPQFNNATQLLFKIMFDDGTFLIRPLDNLVKGLLWMELQQSNEELVDIFIQRLKTFNPAVFDELAEHFYNWSIRRKIYIACERR